MHLLYIMFCIHYWDNMKLTPARQQCSTYWEIWSPTMCVVVLCRSGCRGSWRRRTRCWRRHQRSGAAGWRNRGTDRVGRRDWWRPWCWRTESPEQRPYAWLVLLLSGVGELLPLTPSMAGGGLGMAASQPSLTGAGTAQPFQLQRPPLGKKRGTVTT